MSFTYKAGRHYISGVRVPEGLWNRLLDRWEWRTRWRWRWMRLRDKLR